ncbi:MAG: HEAT repeat domain-containing protein [Candidatus Rokuibacteriota bacterium]
MPATVLLIAGAALAGSLKSFDELLREHGIELTNEAVVQALENPNPEVRWLAAYKLAADRQVDVIPAVRGALAADPRWSNRLNIGYALAQLGDDVGFETLTQVCRSAEPLLHRATAARYLIGLGDPSCFEPLLGLLETEDTDAKIVALSLLGEFEGQVPDLEDRVLTPILDALVDATPAVRLAAVSALDLLDPVTAVKHLEAAAEDEKDESVRSRMMDEVRRLKRLEGVE